MSRGFSQQEKENLRESLIAEFVEELNYRKITSINIDDLVKKVGIAKGSFYLFFSSKDELFAEVINKLQDEIIEKSISIAKENELSDKDRLKKLILYLVDTIYQYPWVKQLSNIEYTRVIRRLPSETKEQLRQKDITDLTRILRILNLKSDYSFSKIMTMFQIIFSSALNKKDYGDQYDEAVKTMIDILIENIFK